jgi:hypothetical protein
MDDYLFTVADFSHFDWVRARGDRSRKDTFLRIRLWRGYLYLVRAEQ